MVTIRCAFYSIIVLLVIVTAGCSIDDSSLKVGMSAPSLRTKTLHDVGGDFSRITTYRYPDERIHSVFDYLLNEQMSDGGWNCDRIKGATHSSFHTTISVLEGLHEYASVYPASASLIDATQRAHEFLLEHHLYKSHRTGKTVHPTMTRMHFPPRWHYDFIRALDYFQNVNAPRDERMNDAMELLFRKQRKDGCWPAYRPWTGRMYFEMEKAGASSRWNTLRALRVLKWWEGKSIIM